MAVVPSLILCWVWLSVSVLRPAASEDQNNITAESGQNLTLKCRAPNNNINILEWSRGDLGDEYVFFFRNQHFVPDNQHPSFKNRVDLQDRQMKGGDVSLVLKDVTINDAGTYECRVKAPTARRKRANLDSEPISIINLRVVDPPDRKTITAESGQNVTLPCRAPNNKNDNVRVAKWSRSDMKSEPVLLYRDGQFDPEQQHPSFKDRVDLQDHQMKDGDVSLVLKNVRLDDQGTYECRVETQVHRRKRANQGDDPIRTIYLRVDPPGPTGGGQNKDRHNRNHYGLALLLVVTVMGLIIGVLYFKKYTQKKSHLNSSSDENQRNSCVKEKSLEAFL